jgi:hypothetical protein
VPKDAVDQAFKRLQRLAREAALPGVEIGTSYKAPALRVGGKPFVTVRDTETLSLACSLDHKEFLINAAPEIYYETPHYAGWPAVIVRLGAIGDAELKGRLVEAWRFRAPRRLGASFLAS